MMRGSSRCSTLLTAADAVLVALVLFTSAEAVFLGAMEELSEPHRGPEALLRSYDKDAPPSLQDPTEVQLKLDIKHVTLNEMQFVMSMNTWIKMDWRDSRLRWDGTGNESSVFWLRTDIWHPDIVLKNSFSGKGEDLYVGSMILGHADGHLEWTSSALLETYCNLDLRNWPFEQHECEFVLGSWTLTMEQFHIGHAECNFDEVSGQSGEFAVEAVPITRRTHRDGMEDVVLTVVLRRRPGTNRAVIFVPAFVVIILCLATFLLPPKSGEKVVLGGLNAMLICVFLIYFAHSLPVLTNQTPLVVVFYATSLYLVCFSLVIAVLVLNLSRLPHSNAVPLSIMKTLTGTCGRFLLLRSYIEQVMDVPHARCGGSQNIPSDERPVVLEDHMAGPLEMQLERPTDRAPGKPQSDWVLLAAAIDRVLFIVYSLLFMAFAIAFHV